MFARRPHFDVSNHNSHCVTYPLGHLQERNREKEKEWEVEYDMRDPLARDSKEHTERAQKVVSRGGRRRHTGLCRRLRRVVGKA